MISVLNKMRVICWLGAFTFIFVGLVDIVDKTKCALIILTFWVFEGICELICWLLKKNNY